jgi:hypothetical protein
VTELEWLRARQRELAAQLKPQLLLARKEGREELLETEQDLLLEMLACALEIGLKEGRRDLHEHEKALADALLGAD